MEKVLIYEQKMAAGGIPKVAYDQKRKSCCFCSCITCVQLFDSGDPIYEQIKMQVS